MVAMLVAVAVVLTGAWLKPLDERAKVAVEDGLVRALAIFATARSLNAIISVVQGTEVSVQPAGFGPNFAPGQILDPVNDLVEQFSELMLLVSVSFGLQLFLINVGGDNAVSWMLSVVAVAWIWACWRQAAAQALLTRLLLGLVLIRFAIPIVVVASGAIFQSVLDSDYTKDKKRIDVSESQIVRLTTPAGESKAEEGLMERMKRWFAQGSSMKKEIERRADELRQISEETVKSIVRLIAVFLLQTLVLPLLILWLLLRLGGILGDLALPRRQSGSTIV